MQSGDDGCNLGDDFGGGVGLGPELGVAGGDPGADGVHVLGRAHEGRRHEVHVLAHAVPAKAAQGSVRQRKAARRKKGELSENKHS